MIIHNSKVSHVRLVGYKSSVHGCFDVSSGRDDTYHDRWLKRSCGVEVLSCKSSWVKSTGSGGVELLYCMWSALSLA